MWKLTQALTQLLLEASGSQLALPPVGANGDPAQIGTSPASQEPPGGSTTTAQQARVGAGVEVGVAPGAENRRAVGP